jgi:hypothetical protein
MASNYNSLGFNLMTTGENAGTWGTNTNLNLNYLRDTFGWITIEMTADRTLTIPDNSTGTYDGRAFIIQLTGSTAGNRILDIADEAGSGSSPGGTADILKPFLVIDSTTRAAGNTITFKVTGATGILIPKYGNIFCYHDGTDIRSSGMVSTRGSAGTRAAQPAYTLPAADGSADQILSTDGAGEMSFVTPAAPGISTGKAIAMAMIFG